MSPFENLRTRLVRTRLVTHSRLVTHLRFTKKKHIIIISKIFSIVNFKVCIELTTCLTFYIKLLMQTGFQVFWQQ